MYCRRFIHILHQYTNARLSVSFRDPVVTSNSLPFSMLSKHCCVGAAAATCLALVILVATIHSTTAQHLTVVPNTSISLRRANTSTSLEILGEYDSWNTYCSTVRQHACHHNTLCSVTQHTDTKSEWNLPSLEHIREISITNLQNMTTNRKSGSTENISKICSYEEQLRTYKCNNKWDA